MSSINRLVVCVTLFVFGIGSISRAQVPPPTSGPTADQMIAGMHAGLERVGQELGGLTDDEKTKVDAWEKKLEGEITADPSKMQSRDSEQSSMKEFRELLNADHQTKFDDMMDKSRKMAGRIMSQSNLKQLGLAGMLWSNENNGKYAPDLGALTTEDLSPKAFLVADSKTVVPADWATMDAKAKADWANKNSDFVYLGADQKTAGDAGFVVAYVKAELATDGNEFLMGDGSVQTKTADECKAIIADLKDGKNPPPSMK